MPVSVQALLSCLLSSILTYTAMFNFFFKKREPEIVIENSQKKEIDSGPMDAKGSDKQVELLKAVSFSGQEEAALEFILQSNFADARLQALQHIHSVQALTQISAAMRNTDRRVSKLAQEKLSQLQYQKKMHVDVQACLAHGQQLMQQPYLVANQVSAWDKERLSLGEYGASLAQIKLDLDSRLLEQIDLQRQVMQMTMELHSIIDLAMPVEQFKQTFDACATRYQDIQSHRLVHSLPKNQLAQLAADISLAETALQRVADGNRIIEQRASLLRSWELEENLDLIKVKKERDRCAPVNLIFDEVRQQQLCIQEEAFNAILASGASTEPVRAENASRKSSPKAKPHSENVDLGAALIALEQALEAGALQQALDIDKSLRQSDIRLERDASQRLQSLRHELNRLLDWAKWGGNISREELTKVADGLMQVDISPAELAKQVGGLRARWKELDRTSGASGQAAWEKFDGACTRAYAIAEAHFKQQAQLRSDNLLAAQNLLTALEQTIADLPEQILDWKAHQATITKIKTDWRNLGMLDRKSRTRLQADFDQKIARLNQPLLAAREAAVAIRQQLILSVTTIEANDRSAVDKVKSAQQRWQQEATAQLLDRKNEQDLWHQFRTACDAIFARRKEQADQQQQQRQQLLVAKQVYCEGLEAMADKSAADISFALRSAQHQWRELSLQYRGLDARFETAVKNLELKQAEFVAGEKQAELLNLRDKVNLCQQVEAANRAPGGLDADQIAARLGVWQAEWEALSQFKSAGTTATLNKGLAQRYNDAMNSRQSAAADDLSRFEESLLRVEMLRNLPGPAELSQQRLKLQVQDLQAALKNRDQAGNYANNFYLLCTLPIALAGQLEERFQRVLEDSIKA